MDRRENLKVLITGTVATGLLISTGCKDEKTVVRNFCYRKRTENGGNLIRHHHSYGRCILQC